jgi:hypothetical protein
LLTSARAGFVPANGFAFPVHRGLRPDAFQVRRPLSQCPSRPAAQNLFCKPPAWRCGFVL